MQLDTDQVCQARWSRIALPACAHSQAMPIHVVDLAARLLTLLASRRTPTRPYISAQVSAPSPLQAWGSTCVSLGVHVIEYAAGLARHQPDRRLGLPGQAAAQGLQPVAWHRAGHVPDADLAVCHLPKFIWLCPWCTDSPRSTPEVGSRGTLAAQHATMQLFLRGFG